MGRRGNKQREIDQSNGHISYHDHKHPRTNRVVSSKVKDMPLPSVLLYPEDSRHGRLLLYRLRTQPAVPSPAVQSTEQTILIVSTGTCPTTISPFFILLFPINYVQLRGLHLLYAAMPQYFELPGNMHYTCDLRSRK